MTHICDSFLRRQFAVERSIRVSAVRITNYPHLNYTIPHLRRDVITLASKAEVLGVLGEAMRRATAKLTAGKGAAAEGAAAAAVQ